MAEDWRRGIPPVAGGALDQAEGISQAVRVVWSEQARWKAAKMEAAARGR